MPIIVPDLADIRKLKRTLGLVSQEDTAVIQVMRELSSSVERVRQELEKVNGTIRWQP
jgi:hypothetical protein